MKLNWAHLCDYAFAVGDKPGLIGIFSVINAFNFPAVHPLAYLVFEVGLAPAEIGRDVEITISVRDADGQQIAELKVGFRPEGKAPPGTTPTIRQIIPMHNMQFERPGEYEFAFFLNGNYADSARLQVAQAQRPGQ